MPIAPDIPRAVAFFDGQNLFDAVKKSFGYTFPNYDVKALAKRICGMNGWKLTQTRFYTGVPEAADNAFWNHFWSKKFLMMRREGVYTFSRPVRYIKMKVPLPDGTVFEMPVGDEKGIDVRIAIDTIRLAHKRRYDVALLFCQDQDLSELATEIRSIAKEQARWIKIASAFPKNDNQPYLNRGIERTDWISFDKRLYDKCIDHRDYRPKPSPEE